MDRLTGLFRPIVARELAKLAADSEASAASREPVELDQKSVGRLSRMDAMQAREMAEEAERCVGSAPSASRLR